VNPLTLTIVLYLFKSLHQYHISKLSSTPFLLLSISLFIVYTVNLPVVRPRSCRVIYYLDTPTLERRHQLFDRVTTALRTCMIGLNFICLIVCLFIFVGLCNLILACIFMYCLCIFFSFYILRMHKYIRYELMLL
jgi:hypothetical protein